MNTDIAFGIIISLLFISLVVLFCAVIIKLYIQKIKEHNLKELTFQKTLNTTILETQEQLLNTISQDLHDDAGQQLTVINFQLENLKLDHPDCEHNLSPISESVSHLSESLRKISHSLNSNWLSENGLIQAITLEVNRLQKNKTIPISMQVSEITKKWTAEEQIVIFRIFQECINNTLKHSKAKEIHVNIESNPVFKITLHDNGIGFDFQKAIQKNDSIGIKNCIQRAAMIQYTFDIQSKPNNGTTVVLQENKL